jgi:urease accessory protein
MMRLIYPMAFLMLSALPAFAHGDQAASGFVSGFLHPLFGWDHVVAMIAVGLWGAVLGPPAIWILPIVFPLIMALGGSLGVMGIPIPGVETGIAASALVLGLLVAFSARLPLGVCAVIVGVFAIFHGHAHGTELPAAVNPMSYAAGFIVATGLLHLLGILFGLVDRWPWGRNAIKAGGALVAAAGLAFLTCLA